MDPSQLRELLNVLRDAGVSTAEVPVEVATLPDGRAAEWAPLRVTFASPGGNSSASGEPASDVPIEELPAGAFDPIARRKAAAKARP